MAKKRLVLVCSDREMSGRFREFGDVFVFTDALLQITARHLPIWTNKCKPSLCPSSPRELHN